MTQCNQVCYEYQTSLKMFNKFDNIWQKLDLKDKNIEKACEENLKKTAWLVYIVAKHSIFEEEAKLNMHGNHSLLEFAFLILAVLHTVILHSNHSKDSQSDVEIPMISSFKANHNGDGDLRALSEHIMRFLESALFS